MRGYITDGDDIVHYLSVLILSRKWELAATEMDLYPNDIPRNVDFKVGKQGKVTSFTLLHLACCHDPPSSFVSKLIEHNWKWAEEKCREYGSLPLHYACLFKTSSSVIRLLIRNHRTSVYMKNKDGNLALHMLVDSNQLEAVDHAEYIMELNHLAVIARNTDGEKPMDRLLRLKRGQAHARLKRALQEGDMRCSEMQSHRSPSFLRKQEAINTGRLIWNAREMRFVTREENNRFTAPGYSSIAETAARFRQSPTEVAIIAAHRREEREKKQQLLQRQHNSTFTPTRSPPPSRDQTQLTRREEYGQLRDGESKGTGVATGTRNPTSTDEAIEQALRELQDELSDTNRFISSVDAVGSTHTMAGRAANAAASRRTTSPPPKAPAASNATKTPSAPASATNGVKQCVVCFDADASFALVPCGHVCLCKNCSTKKALAKLERKCPECRRRTREVVRIYGKVMSSE
jgi:hypothetical protein